LYKNDGTYILLPISHIVYCNNVAFLEHIREKVMNATLSQFQHDIKCYTLHI